MKNQNLLNLKKEQNENRLIRKMIDSYDLINNYRELSAEELIKGAKFIVKEGKVHNYRHVAFKFIERAVQKGSSEAKLILAKMYYNGYGPKRNYEKAATLFKELSNEGNITAKRFYADLIYYALIEYPERKDCVDLYRDSAIGGDLVAKYRLANIYRLGDFADKPDYNTAILYYEDILSKEFGERDANIMAACYRELMHCQLENFYLQEANSTRNYEYYKKRPSLNNLTKKYNECAQNIIRALPDNQKEEFLKSIEVYNSIIKDDSLDVSKISYGEFRKLYFNKHPKIFLTTKKTEYLIYKHGLRNYFVMRDDAEEELEHELQEKEKHAIKQKVVLKKVFENLSIAKPTGEITAEPKKIEEGVDNSVQNFKNNYNVDYSLCVTNLDKYLEEIIYQIFVEGLHNYKKERCQQQINEIIEQINLELNSTVDLKNLVHLITGDASQIPEKNYKKILQKFIKDIVTNRQANRTITQIDVITSYFNFAESVDVQEDFLINDILELYDECAALRQLKLKETFTLGELFNIAFAETLGDDRKTENMLKMEILDYVLKISNKKDSHEVYLKLNELILKLEHFRVMVRNVASHKSVLTQRAIENGLNICITQETSIFNLLDELFGDYLEKQTYITETKKYLAKTKTKVKEEEIDTQITNVINNLN